jgi:hypothetical protein
VSLTSLKPSIPIRIIFLIVVASSALHLSLWLLIGILFGYSICSDIDKHFATRVKVKAINDAFSAEIDDWKQHPDKPDWEEKDDMDRIKLPQQERIVVYRVAEAVRRMMLAR